MEKTIQEQVREEYKKLPAGSKELAAQVYGCHPNYFRRFVNGDVKEESTYYIALESIKQAKKKWLKTIIGVDLKKQIL